MVKLILGVKGTGKTKTLIEMVNRAQQETKGCVVCIEKGNKLRFDINSQIRLIDTVEYLVSDAQSLYGFVAGIAASDHDITDLFIDSTLKICAEDVAAYEKLVLEIATLADKIGFNVVMTASMPTENCPEALRQYM